MEAVDYLSTMRRYWRAILTITLIGGIVAAGLGLLFQPQAVAQYSVTASAVLLTPQARETVDEQLPRSEQYVATTSLLVPVDTKGASLVPTLAQVLISDVVLTKAAESLGTTVDDVQARLSVSVPPGTEIMEISAIGPDESAARRLGAAVTQALTSQLAAFDSTVAAPTVLGTALTKPRLAPGFSPEQRQVEVARLARELIAADPTAAQTMSTPELARFDESLAAELITDLKLSSQPGDLLKAIVINSVAGVADPATGVIPHAGEITVSVTANDSMSAASLARGTTRLLQERAARISGGDLQAASPLVLTSVSDSSVINAVSHENRTLTNLILGLLIGFAAGAAYAFFRASRDTIIRSPRQLLALTDTPPIGVITARQGDTAPAWVALDMGDPASDGYRSLRSNLLFGAPDLRVLAVTSAEAGDGKLTLAVNLAIALAQSGRSVALVETDLRNPRLAKVLGLSPERGLVDVLSATEAGTSVRDAEQPWQPERDLRRIPGAQSF